MYDNVEAKIEKLRGQIETIAVKMIEAESEEYTRLAEKLERLEDKLERLELQASDMADSLAAYHEANDY